MRSTAASTTVPPAAGNHGKPRGLGGVSSVSSASRSGADKPWRTTVWKSEAQQRITSEGTPDAF
ncbi:MAG: hypothetical protein HY716_15895 [Planctomycetes bacterium]|nr:hypothetical protein [Planctomycetota bacterium]